MNQPYLCIGCCAVEVSQDELYCEQCKENLAHEIELDAPVINSVADIIYNWRRGNIEAEAQTVIATQARS